MKKNKFYEIPFLGKSWKVELRKCEYFNGNLAIIMLTDDGEEFATLTVNLGFTIEGNEAFIDTNNCEWAESFLKENKIARNTGLTAKSGFCVYPLYKFNEEILKEMPAL